MNDSDPKPTICASELKPTIHSLDALVRAAARDQLPPVDTWDPEHCGDIDLEIRADGTWFYQGTPIGRPRLVRLFSRILRREPDGSHVLVTPVEKVLVRVEDAPFLAVEMHAEGNGCDQTLTFRTNVDDIVIVNGSHPIRFETEAGSGGLKPYLKVRGGLEARLSRALVFDLAELAVENKEGATGIWSAGRWFEMAPST